MEALTQVCNQGDACAWQGFSLLKVSDINDYGIELLLLLNKDLNHTQQEEQLSLFPLDKVGHIDQ